MKFERRTTVEQSENFVQTDLDKEILNNMIIAPYMGKVCVRFYPDDYTTRNQVGKRLKQLHITSKDEYFKLLGFEGFQQGRTYDDNEIKRILESCEDEDHHNWIPRDSINRYLYQRASREGLNIVKFVSFFGYGLETESIEQSYKTATERYRLEILDNLHKKGTKYFVWSTTPIRGKLNQFAKNRHIDYKEYLPKLIEYWVNKGLFIEPISPEARRDMKNIDVFSGNPSKLQDISEMILEKLIDANFNIAGYSFSNTFEKYRKNCYAKITELKKIYMGRCQICGKAPNDANGEDITEAHHIEPFCKNCNNDFSNIIILCPNHHRVLHKLNAEYDRKKNLFVLSNGKILRVSLDEHLKPRESY